MDRTTLENADKYMDEMEDNPALPDTESKIWERNNLGKSITHRLSKIEETTSTTRRRLYVMEKSRPIWAGQMHRR